MSIGNYISNYVSTVWLLHPVSHLNEDGSVKTMETYKDEYETEIKGKLFDEHVELLAKNSDGSLFTKSMNKLGKILSLKYTSAMFTQDLGGKVFISPVNHYNSDGSLKNAVQYEADLRDEKAQSCVYHQTLIEYEQSNYLELSCNKLGEVGTHIWNGNMAGALIGSVGLAAYGSGFILHYVAYSGLNLSYGLLSSLSSVITSEVKSVSSYLENKKDQDTLDVSPFLSDDIPVMVPMGDSLDSASLLALFTLLV